MDENLSISDSDRPKKRISNTLFVDKIWNLIILEIHICVINPKHKKNSNYRKYLTFYKSKSKHNKKIKNRSICIYGLIGSLLI